MRLAFAACLLAGCSVDVTDFDVGQAITEHRISGSPLPAPLGTFPLPVSLDLSAQIARHHAGPIHSVTIAALELTITATAQPDGDADNWSFIDELHVTVRSNRDDSELPRVEIASVVAPGPVTTMTFAIADGVDIKPYVDEGSVVECTGRASVPGDDVSYVGMSRFTVHPF